MPHKFLVHAKDDSVGVAVEKIRAGETVEGIFLVSRLRFWVIVNLS